MLVTQPSTFRHHTADCCYGSGYTLVLSGWTGLPGRLRDGASEGLGELRTHSAEDRILPCWGKSRWKDPNTSLNITQLRSLQPRRQVMSWTEVGLESERFKPESLLLNQLAIRFWTNHLILPSWGFLTYKMTLMPNPVIVRIKWVRPYQCLAKGSHRILLFFISGFFFFLDFIYQK